MGLAWATAAVALGTIFACSSGGSSSNGGFPYSGPSCTSSDISSACWQCLLNSCGGNCITSECSSFFTCYCDCPADDGTCQQQCGTTQTSSACDSCVDSVGTCSSGTCASECSGSTVTGGSSSGGGSGSSSGGSTSFPFSGPSCTTTTFEQTCWQCASSHCQAGCLTSDCSAYFDCYCACALSDTSCQTGCATSTNITSACTSCVEALGTCEEQSCPSQCSLAVDGG